MSPKGTKKDKADALSLIRKGRRSASVSPRLDPLTQSAPLSAVQLVPLVQINDRVKDTRSVRDEHVEQLFESMTIVGLISPLTVDKDYTLLAGAHRLAALKLLREREPTLFLQQFPDGRIPTRVMSLSASTDQLLALRVEIEENEKRRDYTPQEVLEVAQNLENAGFSRSRGRPAAGERPLIPALETIFGKSKATIKRYLSAAEQKKSDAGEDEHEEDLHEKLKADQRSMIAKLDRLERSLRSQLACWKTPLPQEEIELKRQAWMANMTQFRHQVIEESNRLKSQFSRKD